MTSHWIEFNGSNKQIADIKGKSFLLRFKDGRELDYSDTNINVYSLSMLSDTISHYLICEPHPYADMICQWARTGQPVYIKYTKPTKDGFNIEWFTDCTNAPDWNIPDAEYIFTPFEGEV